MLHLARGSVWLPIIATPPADPVAVFYDLLLSDARQQRPRLEVCKVLQAGAQQRAWGLANGQPWAHHDSAGRGANGIARSLGCNLPGSYSDNENYVESLTAGTGDGQEAFNSLARSAHHRTHLFGENDFFRQQYHVGVGFAQNGGAPYQFYWTIWCAACLD